VADWIEFCLTSNHPIYHLVQSDLFSFFFPPDLFNLVQHWNSLHPKMMVMMMMMMLDMCESISKYIYPSSSGLLLRLLLL
jgi:hypothetical protein